MASGGNVAVTKKLTPPERREGAGFTIKDLMSGLSDAETHKLCRYDMNGFRAKITFTKNPGDLNELTCDADLVTTGEHKDSAAPATDIVCTAQDQNVLELGAINTVIGSTIGGGNGGQIQTNMDLSQTMTHGDRLKFGGNVYTIAGPIVAPAAAAVGLSKYVAPLAHTST